MRLLVKDAGLRARSRARAAGWDVPGSTHRRLSQTPEKRRPPGPLPGACPWGWKPKEGCGLCAPGDLLPAVSTGHQQAAGLMCPCLDWSLREGRSGGRAVR